MAKRRSGRLGGAGLALAVFAGCTSVDRTSADRFTANGEVIALSGGDAGAANACITCHGLDGLGNGAGTPRIAGLQFGYLVRQLDAYATGLREHAEMHYISKRLSYRDRQAVSAYYAEMPFAPGEMPALPAPRLYVSGDPQRGLAACLTCHGARGEGLGPANPALGGQPAAYHEAQLQAWNRSKRRNDPLNVMLAISQKLAPAERSALAAYSAALPGGPPSPGHSEAYPEGRRVDPRSGASTLRPHEAAQ